MKRDRPGHPWRWQQLTRRALAALSSAVLTVFVASRINPPDPAPAMLSPDAADELLAEVNLDDRTFPLAIASIQNVRDLIDSHAQPPNGRLRTLQQNYF